MKKYYHLKLDGGGRSEPLNLTVQMEPTPVVMLHADGVHDLSQFDKHGKMYTCASCGMSTCMFDQVFRVVLGNSMTRQSPFQTCAEYLTYAVMNS